jgi:hypothetical protein
LHGGALPAEKGDSNGDDEEEARSPEAMTALAQAAADRLNTTGGS